LNELRDTISLLELNQSIQLEIKSSFDSAYWVFGEINDHKVNYSGHCYLELIEKDKISEVIVAKVRATIWAGTYRKLLPYFETTAGHAFCEGIKVLVRVTVEFHELYGLSLNIIDIDPAYTLGDLQQQKMDAINRLKNDGVFYMNKELHIPRVIQKIAVISSAKAAGYGDFHNQLSNNEYGYKFYTRLFPAIMQGESSEQSIIDALEKIYEHEDFFDTIVIIRGGGSKSDLSCFDRYWLAYHVANYPLPVLTGIGHEQDDTVIDMVAHTRLKTPTAVASFIIDKAISFETELDQLYEIFRNQISRQILDLKQYLFSLTGSLASNIRLTLSRNKEATNNIQKLLIKNVKGYLGQKKQLQKNLIERSGNYIYNSIHINFLSLNYFKKTLSSKIDYYIKNKKKHIEYAGNLLKAYDPQNVLDRGYSITLFEGKVVKSENELNIGNEIKTQLKKGMVKSKVIKK